MFRGVLTPRNTHEPPTQPRPVTQTGLLALTGSLGTSVGGNAGFDIYSGLSSGKTVSVTGFATLTPSSGIATLYNVNLLTGSAGFVGEFPLAISTRTDRSAS